MNDAANLERAYELIRTSVVCDAIVPWTEYGDPTLRAATVDRYLGSGFNFISLSLCSDEEDTRDVLRAVSRVRHDVATDARLVLAVEAATISADKDQITVSMNCQGTNFLGGDLRLVEVFRSLGVAQALLVYNRKNAVGDGCHERTDCGLSGYGLELIAEMNRVGMTVDCSHCGVRTSLEAIDASSAPAIFSHSNSRALFEHDRNIEDEQARACAEKGGWIGVNGLGIFMDPAGTVLEQLFKNIDHYCELVGPAHVGLGTDFLYDIEDMKRYMRNINSPTSGGYDNIGDQFEPELLPSLVQRMLTAGYADNDIRGILGANYLRVTQAQGY